MESRRSAWLALVLMMAGGAAAAAEPLAMAANELAAGDYAAALNALDALPRSEARAIEARFLRGVALLGSERLDEAATLFEALIADQPQLPEVYNNLAAVYVRQGRLNEAKQLLERALATDPRYATVYENLSSIYVEQARSSYAKALRLDAVAQAPHLSVLNTVQTPQPKAVAPVGVAAAEPAVQPKPESKPVARPVVAAAAMVPPAAETLPIEAVPGLPPPELVVPRAPAAVKPASEPPASVPPVIVAVAAPKPAAPAPAVPQAKLESAPVAARVTPEPEAVIAPVPAAEVAPGTTVVATATFEPAPTEMPARLRLAVLNAVDGWARAWSEQNPDKYLAYYAADYVPEDMSRSVWEEERRLRLGRPAWIKVTLEQQEVSANSADEAVVTLRQRYASPNYKDITHKRLTLALRDGNWVITSETNLKVRR